MKLRRDLVLALLLYVGLDLSVPTIPGAFVFEAAASAESTQVGRGRGAPDVVLLPAPARQVFVVSQPQLDVVDRLAPPGQVAPPTHRVVSHLPRATLVPPPPSEDSH